MSDHPPGPRWDERDHNVDGWVTAAPSVLRFVPRPRVVTPAPDEPADWMVIECRVPGVHRGPYAFAQAIKTARVFGGKVRPWAAGEPKALGNYPHPGKMVPSGGGTRWAAPSSRTTCPTTGSRFRPG